MIKQIWICQCDICGAIAEPKTINGRYNDIEYVLPYDCILDALGFDKELVHNDICSYANNSTFREKIAPYLKCIETIDAKGWGYFRCMEAIKYEIEKLEYDHDLQEDKQ